MKPILSFVLVALIFFSSVASTIASDKPPYIDWSSLKSSFGKYADFPTSENARDVIALLPDSHINFSSTQEEHETVEFIYSWSQLGILERQVISGDKDAVRLSYKLRTISDGAFSESLDIMLGQLIRIRPELFLQGLHEFQDLVFRYDSLVGNTGEVYVDRFKAQCYEINLRIESLLKVNDPVTLQVRDKCIATLRDQNHRHCSDV